GVAGGDLQHGEGLLDDAEDVARLGVRVRSHLRIEPDVEDPGSAFQAVEDRAKIGAGAARERLRHHHQLAIAAAGGLEDGFGLLQDDHLVARRLQRLTDLGESIRRRAADEHARHGLMIAAGRYSNDCGSTSRSTRTSPSGSAASAWRAAWRAAAELFARTRIC